MPRPVKCRKVCHFPNVLEFLPADNAEKKVPIVLTVDEYETIRLLDKKGYSQEQCLYFLYLFFKKGISKPTPLKDMIVLQPDKLPAKASITAASSSGDSAKYWSITIRFLMRLAQPIM